MKSVILDKVSYCYEPDVYAVKDLSLEVEEGSYISLVGHNGSGKSTIAKLLIGLLPLGKGEIYINGLKLNRKNLTAIRSQVGIVFQNPDNQFIGATVEDDIAFGLENRMVAHDDMQPIIEEFARKVGVSDHLKKEPTRLSGGQKQRVALAGVLALSPKVLILDEATSMLDPRGRREVSEVIREMRRNYPKLTIISITHDVEEAYNSDKVMLMKNGVLKAFDTPDKIFENETLIKECELTKPFLLELKDECSKHGIDIENVTTIEEGVEKICQ